MRLICQICGEYIGEISLEGVDAEPGRPAIDALKSPLLGLMVGSPDPFHDFPAPFDPAATWEFWFCPFSNRTHWPFENTGVEPKQLLTHKGMIDIPTGGLIIDGIKLINVETGEDVLAKEPDVSEAAILESFDDAREKGLGVVKGGQRIDPANMYEQPEAPLRPVAKKAAPKPAIKRKGK